MFQVVSRTESLYLDLYVVAVVGEEDEGADRERHCDSLIMCILTTLNEGLRNGGGIGDVLRKPSRTVRNISALHARS